MKVAVFASFPSGPKVWREHGFYERNFKLFREMERNGLEVSCFYYGKDDQEFNEEFDGSQSLEGERVSNFPRPLRFIMSFFYPFLQNFKDSEGILSLQVWGAWVPALAKIFWRKKFILRTGYDHYFFKLKQNASLPVKMASFFLSWFAYKAADQIVITSREQKKFIVETFGLDANKVHVFYNFIETDVFKPHPGDISPKRDLVFVGRLNQQKNLENLIKGVQMAGASLDIIGDGEQGDDLSELAESLGADVRFLGRVENTALPEHFPRYKAFALVSHYEGNPKTLLEAMACGLPQVASNSPGIKEIAEEGNFGEVSGTGPESIADAIKSLENFTELEQMGREARDYVRKNSSLESYAQLLKKLLDESK